MRVKGLSKYELIIRVIFLLFFTPLIIVSAYAKDPVPNLYLDIPAPILSQWNKDNIMTVDGVTGATSKSYIYSSQDAAKQAASEDGDWDTDSVAYITWELDNGSGRAPGLQILNDNLDYSFHNCIMASGEMESPDFPDTVVSKACNDASGSSKRYFLQLTETDTPIDLVFDLGVKDIRYKGLIDEDQQEEGDSGTGTGSEKKENTISQFREEYGIGRIYRVIQKIKNNTNKRIASYKFELGTGLQDQFQALNFAEHGVGFEMRTTVPREFFDGRTGSAPDVSVWKSERFATFAPKLFDDGSRVRFSPGFLDHDAAGFMDPQYLVDMDLKSQYIDSGLSIDEGVIGSLTKNFFNINETHDAALPGNMLGYMLPNNQVPSVIAYWLKNDINAESDGVVAIWDGADWRSGRSGLDGDPDTIDDNFGVVPLEQLAEWAEKPLGLNLPYEDPADVIRYDVIPSDDIAGLNTDIYIHIDEKLLDEDNELVFSSITLRVTARSIDDVLLGAPGSEEPDWIQAGHQAPPLSAYKAKEDVLSAFNEYVTTDAKTPVTINVLENDLLNGEPLESDTAIVAIVEEPINGEAVWNTDLTVTYTPADYFSGYEVFDYQVTIDDHTSNVASVKVLVDPEVVLGAPVIENDNQITTEGVPIKIDVLANDEYTLGNYNLLTVSITNGPSNGTSYVTDDKEIEYTPALDFTGIEQFTYTVSDDGKVSNTGVVTVRVDEYLDDEEVVSTGGGCTMGDPNAPKDPTLLLLMLASMIAIIRRRIKERHQTV